MFTVTTQPSDAATGSRRLQQNATLYVHTYLAAPTVVPALTKRSSMRPQLHACCYPAHYVAAYGPLRTHWHFASEQTASPHQPGRRMDGPRRRVELCGSEIRCFYRNSNSDFLECVACSTVIIVTVLQATHCCCCSLTCVAKWIRDYVAVTVWLTGWMPD